MSNMQNEPIRLPAWTWALITLVAAPTSAWLLGADWKVSLGTALAALVPTSGVVAKAESNRAFTNSPVTAEIKRQETLDTLANGDRMKAVRAQQPVVPAEPFATSGTSLTNIDPASFVTLKDAPMQVTPLGPTGAPTSTAQSILNEQPEPSLPPSTAQKIIAEAEQERATAQAIERAIAHSGVTNPSPADTPT